MRNVLFPLYEVRGSPKRAVRTPKTPSPLLDPPLCNAKQHNVRPNAIWWNMVALANFGIGHVNFMFLRVIYLFWQIDMKVCMRANKENIPHASLTSATSKLAYINFSIKVKDRQQWSFFKTYFCRLHKIKTRTYIKNLNHDSLHYII